MSPPTRQLTADNRQRAAKPRITAVVIAILAALPALPQCNFTPVRSAQFRTSALDLSIDGNDLWVATSYGVSLYDRSVDPPKLTATIAIAGTTRVVRASNDLAYAGSGSSLVVIQKGGPHNLQIARSIDNGGTINDIVVTTLALYVAGSNGITQYDLLIRSNPARTTTTFATSRTAVNSLAVISSTMYAADGDSSIEAFNIAVPSLPQSVGSITAPSAVSFVDVNNGKLFASGGTLTTHVFAGSGASMTNIGTAAFGTSSLAPIGGDAVFMAGFDRRLRAADFTVSSSPVEIFRADLPPTSGTINRVAALATANNRLYVAAGDIGLLTYDITGFIAPFPVRAYSTGSSTSIFSTGEKVYVSRDTGGVTEFSQSASGALTQARSWDGSRSDLAVDGRSDALLTSSGSSMTLWTLTSTIPQPIGNATFRAPVVSAAVIGFVGYAVLSDRTLWSADFAQATPAPVQIKFSDIKPSAISRSGSSIVLADLRDDGTTSLAFFATPDFTATPKTASVPGIAVTGVTLSNTTAAVLTFRGITLADFGSGTTTLLPQSSGTLARSLLLTGTKVYEMTDTSLLVWDVEKKAIVTQYTIPADPVALHVGPSSSIADIATGSGVVSIATNATTRLPASIANANPNVYYKKVAATADRIVLFDGRGADIYTNTLRFVSGLRGSIADVAANDGGVFAVTNSLVVSSYTPDGILRGSSTIAEGSDAQPLSIRTVGDAVWVSIIRGCSTFQCEKKTIVFDPRNGMSQTFTLTGAVLDMVTNADRAYAITDLPSEIRVMNVADPFHPSTIVSRAAEASPVSIAYSNSTVYVLGDKLTAYAESTLTPLADILGSYVADPTGVVTSADQRLRIDGNCAVLTGRSFSPQLFTINSAAQWAAAAAFAMPSATRSISALSGTIQLLTDHSLETWSTKPLPKPRREPAR